MDEKTSTLSSDEKYLTVTFDQIGIGSWFYFNGYIHLKTDRTKYITALPQREEVQHCEIGETIRLTTKLKACNVSFSYVGGDANESETEAKVSG